MARRATDALRESPDSSTTPAVAMIAGEKQLVVLGGNYLTGYDAATGAEIWRAGRLNPRNAGDFRGVASPTVRNGMIFAPTRQVPLLEFRAGCSGDTSTSQLAWIWTERSNAPDVPTPMSDGPRFYMVSDQGAITCLDAETGAVIYGRMETGIGRTWSSPVLVDGKIYVAYAKMLCIADVLSTRRRLFSSKFAAVKRFATPRPMNLAPSASNLNNRVSRKAVGLALILAGAATANLTAAAANWPGWRGPNGDGTTTTAKNLPETWSPTQNIKWKIATPAWSGSSPTIWGDRIFLNSPSEEVVAAPVAVAEPLPPGKKKRPAPGGVKGPGGQELLLLCLDRATGKELWRRQHDRGNEIKQKHNMSSPSPVTDGKHVWVVSGNGMVACFDFVGNQKWTFDIPKNFGKIGIQFGYGSSPLLVDGKLVFQMLHGLYTDDPCYLFALNAADGKKLWHVERPTDAEHESPDAYSTPALLVVNGKKQIVVGGSDYVTGHDVETGKELWRGGGLNPEKSKTFRVIASPLVRDGMIFAPTRVKPFIAFKVGGTGDITMSHLAWKWTERGSPDVPTPVSDGERLYMADDRGSITCVNAKTGERIYGPEATGLGTISASPILADGKIYITSESGETAVVQAGPAYKLLGKNSLDGSYTLCTPAAVDGELFIRTGTHLYCVTK